MTRAFWQGSSSIGLKLVSVSLKMVQIVGDDVGPVLYEKTRYIFTPRDHNRTPVWFGTANFCNNSTLGSPDDSRKMRRTNDPDCRILSVLFSSESGMVLATAMKPASLVASQSKPARYFDWYSWNFRKLAPSRMKTVKVPIFAFDASNVPLLILPKDIALAKIFPFIWNMQISCGKFTGTNPRLLKPFRMKTSLAKKK